MADSKGEVGLAPTTIDGVDVTAANTAALNLDLDIEVAEGLRIELVLVESLVGLGRFHLEALELVVLRHFG